MQCDRVLKKLHTTTGVVRMSLFDTLSLERYQYFVDV